MYTAASFAAGFVFGLGLLVSGMVMKERTRTLLGAPVLLPSPRRIDRRLILGSLVFGVGWGLAGICPGPALVLAGAGSAKGLVFLAAMIAGNGVFEFFEKKKRVAPGPAPVRSS